MKILLVAQDWAFQLNQKMRSTVLISDSLLKGCSAKHWVFNARVSFFEFNQHDLIAANFHAEF